MVEVVVFIVIVCAVAVTVTGVVAVIVRIFFFMGNPCGTNVDGIVCSDVVVDVVDVVVVVREGQQFGPSRLSSFVHTHKGVSSQP